MRHSPVARCLAFVLAFSIGLTSLWVRAETIATNETSTKPSLVDVVLSAEGGLQGVLVNREGRPQSGTLLHLLQEDRTVTQVTTDSKGIFRTARLRGGVYQVRTSDHAWNLRLWAHGTAPPQAPPKVLLVDGPVTARGQQPFSKYFLSDGLILAGVFAAAIAIPIAVHDSRDKPGS